MATVVHKERSSYRQPGATMLISPIGQNHGLVSGGCLEAHIARRAHFAVSDNHTRCYTYDSADEDNVAAELGLGCNGRVDVLIQPIGDAERAVLELLHQRFEAQQASLCAQLTSGDDIGAMILFDEAGKALASNRARQFAGQLTGQEDRQTREQSAVKTESAAQASSRDQSSRTDTDLTPPAFDLTLEHQQVETEHGLWSINRHTPPLSLCILGGGIDARPLAKLADMLGWRVSVFDHRVTHARPKDFPADVLCTHTDLGALPDEWRADACVVMTHNIHADAAWLAAIQQANTLPRYLGLLGPHHRKMDVLKDLGIEASDPFALHIKGPMGLDIGGHNPESIALSVVAEIHARLLGPENSGPENLSPEKLSPTNLGSVN